MNYPQIAAALGAPSNESTVTARRAFLADALSPQPRAGAFEEYLSRFTDDGDREGQYAAAGAGVLAIWNSGADLQRYGFWYEKIAALLQDKDNVSSLAVGALLGVKALIELTGENDLQRAASTYEDCLDWCERAGAIPLRAFHTTMRSYCCFWRGELARAEMLLADTASLCAQPETPWPVAANFEITRALSFALQGRMADAEEGFRRVTAHPAFSATQPFVALLNYGHQLYALAQQGITDEVEAIAERVRHLAIPQSNYFHHSYLHFCLGIAHNLLGQPAKGLLHARQAIDIGRKSHSAIARRMPALVVGQALVDLGRDAEATEHLLTWIKEWRASGYAYFAFAGGLELAGLLARRGEIDRARQTYNEAVACLPPDETVPQLLRPPGFVASLHRHLFERPNAWLTDERPARPVHIDTFGELAINIRGRTIYDRQWRGDRTKALLKALLALGPDKVPLTVLADRLWPDSDADQAMSNLKVALSRLRRIGTATDEHPLPWIVVRHGCVSLPAGMCSIDFPAFQETLQGASQPPNIDALVRSLRLYRADFLSKDSGQAWILARRNTLRQLFLHGVVTLTESCLKEERVEVALPCLLQAVSMEPDNEVLCGLLMDVYLRSGQPSKAIEAFRGLGDALDRKHGVEPSPALQQRYAQALVPA